MELVKAAISGCVGVASAGVVSSFNDKTAVLAITAGAGTAGGAYLEGASLMESGVVGTGGALGYLAGRMLSQKQTNAKLINGINAGLAIVGAAAGCLVANKMGWV